MSGSSVSAVVPTYNQASYIEETLDGILSQRPPPTQVIVVDDGSTDDTRFILGRFESVISIIRTPNRGVAAARNTGLAEVRGRYVAFCDSDDVWLPDKLNLQMRRLDATPQSGWCLCGTLLIDELGRELGQEIRGTEGWVFNEIVRLKPHVLVGGGSGVIVRTDLAKGIGGFNENLTTSADWDFYARLAANSPLSFVARPLLKYRVHAAGMHTNMTSWRRDMTAAICGLRDRGLITPAIRSQSLAELEMQIAGESVKRGQRWSTIIQLGRASVSNPLVLSKAAQRISTKIFPSSFRREAQN